MIHLEHLHEPDDVDLLTGWNHRHCHPKGGEDVVNFRQDDSLFRFGVILTGCTNGAWTHMWTSDLALHMTHASLKLPLLLAEKQTINPHFNEAEDLKCAPPKLCNDCDM